MRDWVAQHQRYPQALFTASITLLEGVLAFINDTDQLTRAPARLMTFDDHQLLDCLPVRIDAIVQDSAGLARESLKAVMALLEGRQDDAVSQRVAAHIHRRAPPAN